MKAAPDPLREFLFTEQDFRRIRTLIHEHAGIHLSEAKMDMVYSRLGRRLRATGLRSFRDYLHLLESGNPAEWEAFVNALTTNLTSFFREAHHFPILAEHVSSIRDRRPIELWCSAVSTGEEAYSMAMAMIDLFGSLRPPVRILASDLDTQVLRAARAGRYGTERVEKLSAETLQRFFVKDGTHYLVRQEVRDLIVFRQLNLLDNNWPIHGPFDAIFCRNVMIYFDKPTQYQVLQKFVPLMRPEGLLFAGHSENFHHAADLFTIRERTVYEIADVARHRAALDRSSTRQP